MKTDYTKEMNRIMTEGGKTGDVLKKLRELRKRMMKERKAETV